MGNGLFTKGEKRLDIGNLSIFNRALVRKWMWRLVSDKEGLWRELLRDKYNIKNFDKLIF